MQFKNCSHLHFQREFFLTGSPSLSLTQFWMLLFNDDDTLVASQEFIHASEFLNVVIIIFGILPPHYFNTAFTDVVILKQSLHQQLFSFEKTHYIHSMQ